MRPHYERGLIFGRLQLGGRPECYHVVTFLCLVIASFRLPAITASSSEPLPSRQRVSEVRSVSAWAGHSSGGVPLPGTPGRTGHPHRKSGRVGGVPLPGTPGRTSTGPRHPGRNPIHARTPLLRRRPRLPPRHRHGLRSAPTHHQFRDPL